MPDLEPPLDEEEFQLSDDFFAAHGAYFITLCAYHNRYLFGAATGSPPAINRLGKLAEDEWRRLAELKPAVQLDAFAALPNHLHAIISVDDKVVADRLSLQYDPGRSTLDEVVERYKAAVLRRDKDRGNFPLDLWQPGYHARPIKSPSALAALRSYIRENGLNWALDPLNPDGLRPNPKCLVPEARAKAG
jgi:putative transposase